MRVESLGFRVRGWGNTSMRRSSPVVPLSMILFKHTVDYEGFGSLTF